MSDERPLTEEERAASIDVDIDPSYYTINADDYFPDEWRALLKKADAGLVSRTDPDRSDFFDVVYDADVHLSVMNPPAWLTEGLDGPPAEPEPEDPDAYPFLPKPVPVSEDQAVLL